ncbi:hypothetical protein [Marinobacter sp. CHS3-4]|uniref:hypothetical protein n=1 Tax=Marinobacter sp. CHS3-4 TaxID=3045174 RepID=UPI0024B4CF4D|nr:hypothetical protein [Marinobacter sp. CHS3-4]MDI9244228.1 hypothetical protein [Marinobacter sp. CHS3-4]
MSIERKWWVSGITSLPLYFVVAVIASRLDPLMWLLAVVVGLFVTGVLYQVFVYRLVDKGTTPFFALASWVAVQLIGIAAILWAASAMKSAGMF